MAEGTSIPPALLNLEAAEKAARERAEAEGTELDTRKPEQAVPFSPRAPSPLAQEVKKAQIPSPSFAQYLPPRADPLGVPSPRGSAREEMLNPDFYSQSEVAPPSWQPSPTEVSRLVQAGLLTPEQSKRRELVWKAGRADIARRGGTSWMDRDILEVLQTDMQRGSSVVRKALLTQIPYSMVGGGVPIINTRQMQGEAENIWYSRVLKEMKVAPRSATPEQIADARAEAKLRAARTMSEVMQSGGRRLWADPLDRDLTEEIMESNAVWRMFRALISPVKYGAIGYEELPGGRRMSLSLSAQQLKQESPLSTIARVAPSTLISAAISTDSLPWERPSIEAIRAGEDIVHHVGDIARTVSQTEDEDEGGVPFWAKAAGAGVVLGIILMEPDLFTMAFILPGAAAKGARLGATANKLAKRVSLLEEVAAAAERGGTDLVAAHNRLMAQDAAVGRAVELNAGAQLHVGGMIHKELKNLYDSVPALREKAEELRTQARVAQGEVRTAAKEADALRAEHTAREMDVAANSIVALLTEAEKNAFLMLKGMSWEAAEKVTTRSRVPIDQQALSDMQKVLKGFERELKNLKTKSGEYSTKGGKKYGFKEELKAYEEATNEFAAYLHLVAEGFPAEARTQKGALRRTWDWSPNKEGARLPMIGQTVQFPTKAGGFRKGIVEDITASGRLKPDGTTMRFPSKPPKTTRDDYSIKVKIRVGDEIIEVIHPLKIDYKTGAAIRNRRVSFLRHHGIVAREGGALDQIMELQGAIIDAERAIEMIGEGTGAARAVEHYREAMRLLAASNKEYKVSSKALKAAEKTEDDLVQKWVGVSRKETRTKIQAIENAKIPELFAASTREVAKGLEAFRVHGLKRLGVKGFGSVPDTLQSLGRAALLSGEEVKAFGSRISDTAISDLVKELQKDSLRVDKKAGKAFVDVPRLTTDLSSHVGDETFNELIGGKHYPTLARLIEFAAKEGTPDLPVRMPLSDAARLRDEITDIATRAETQKVFTEETEWGRAIFQAWHDIGLTRKSGGRVKVISDNMRQQVRTLMQMGDNVAVRVGEVSKELEHAMITTERLMDRARLELTEVGRSKALGETPAARFTTYMDATVPLPLKEGMTRWMIATGNGSAFQKGKTQMLGDSRANPMEVERNLAQAEKNRERITSVLQTKLAKPLKLDEDVIPAEEIQELLSEATGDLLVLMESRGVSDGVPLSLTSVSHAWVPPYSGKRIGDDESMLLYVLGRGALKKSKTYAEFSERMRRVTFAVIGEVEGTAARAHASMTSGFMLGGSLGELGYLVERAVGGTIDAKQAANVNRVLTGDFKNIDDLGGALDAMGRMGMPFTQNRIITARSASDIRQMGEKSKELVALGTKEGGPSFVPRVLIDAIEAHAGRIAKDLEATHLAPRIGNPLARPMNAYLSLWRASAVTGLGIPNPRYWTNNIFGDFSQLWIGEGAGSALQRSMINLPTNIPFFGRAMQEKSLYMAELAAAKGGESLPGVIESFLNPYLGRIFQGHKGEFVTKNGEVWTYDQLRTAAIQDGISEAFVRQELLELYGRIGGSFKHGAKENWDEWHRMFNDHAALVQERQRVGMYADLIQKGVPRKEAAERVKKALYDWSHGIAEWEARTISRVVPFWRFWRLTMKQAGDALVEPFVRPMPEMMKKGMTGNSKLARTRQQLLIWPSLPDFLYQEDVNVGLHRNERVNLLAQQLYPDYEDTRAHIGVYPMDPIRARNYERHHGRRYTHESVILPSITAMDSMEMLIALTTGLSIVAGKMIEAVPGKWAERILPGFDEFQLSGDYEARFYEPLLGSTQPLLETAMRSVLSTMGADLDYEVRGDWRNLNANEEEIFQAIPFLRAQMQKDEETGRYRIPASLYLTWRALPIASTQAVAWVSATRNIAWKEGTAAGTQMMLRKLTRFGDVKPFNVYDQLRGRALDIQGEFNEFVRDNKDARTADLSIRGRWARKEAQEEDE